MSTKQPTGKNPLFIAFITIFLDLLGFGIIIPLQPFFAREMGATDRMVMYISATYSIMQFVFTPFWGSLSDRMGRRPIVLFSVLIATIGYFIFAFTALYGASLIWLFVARGISGFGNANIGAAQAIVADTTTPENRSKGMGLIGAAFGLGFIFGPAIGGGLGQIDPVLPLFVAGGLSALNFTLAFKMLPETRQKSAIPTQRELLPIAQLRASAKYINVTTIVFISLITTVAFAQMEQAITLYIDDTFIAGDTYDETRIKAAARLTMYFLIVLGVTATVIQGGLIRLLTRKFGEIRLIQTGVFIMGTSLLFIPVSGYIGHFWILMLIAPYMATGTGLVNPSKSSLLSQSVPADKQGMILGANQSASSLGRVIGPIVAAELYTRQAELPFLVGGGMIILTLVICFRLRQVQVQKQKHNHLKH